MWPLKSIAFMFSFLMACGMSMYFPIVGIVNYMMIYQISPQDRWWGNAIEHLGIRYSFWAGLTMLVGMFANYASLRMRKVRPLLYSWEWLMLLFVTLVLVAYMTAPYHHELQVVVLDKFLKMMLVILCLTHIVTTRRYYHVILWTFVAGTLVLGHDAYTAPADSFIHGRLRDVGGPDFRESSGLGAHMVAMLPLVGCAFFIAKKWWLRGIALVSGVLAVNTLVLCRTRSAFVAILACAVTAALLAPPRWRLRVWPALILAFVGGYYLTDAGFRDRMKTIVAVDEPMEEKAPDTAIEMRKEIWHAGVVMVKTVPGGVGISNFTKFIGGYNPNASSRSSHNTYLTCAAENGVVAFCVFILIVLMSFWYLASVYMHSGFTSSPTETRMMAFTALLSLEGFLVAGFFTERLYTESFWWILAMPLCLHRMTMREIRERQATIQPESETCTLAPLIRNPFPA